MEEPKKISFGFSKLLKKPVAKPPEEKKQFIDCLEGKSIKVKGGEIIEEKKPLVIPLKSKTTTAASLARIAQEVESGILENEILPENEPNQCEESQPPKDESLDARAAREILQDLKKEKITNTKTALIVPVSDATHLTGEKESTLDDYENIPVSDFGLAMLRGMGWESGKGMGKHQKSIDLVLPTLRPKGMGLGADKVMAQDANEKTNGTKKDEIKIIKGTYVKIIAGKQSGVYGQVTGFDEDSGRLMVKAAIGGMSYNLNEFMVVGITKNEYQKLSKVINAAKYEEYKSKELNNHSSNMSRKTQESTTPENFSSQHNRHKKGCFYVERRSRSLERKPHSECTRSQDRTRHKSIEKFKKYSSSSSTSPERKKDKDKKRKGKKKKRDRSRSKEHKRR